MAARLESIECPHCAGKGRLPLSGVYLETLRLVRKQSDEMSGADLSRLDGCKMEAMSNRLRRLEDMGFVTHRRYGREKLWKAVKQ